MFRSSTIIRELALNLAKVIFMLKNSVKLRRYLIAVKFSALTWKGCGPCPVFAYYTLALPYN
jgi:hypothetical protein